jgi:RNA polymerase sigma-70 factor (ECF subfamily)
LEESLIIREIQNRNSQVYETLFHTHYNDLVRFAEGIIFDPQLAEDVVQNLFIHFWENANNIQIKSSLRAYLFRAVKNRCLNRLKELQIRDKNGLLYFEGMMNSGNINIEEEEADLILRLNSAINKLPDKMAQIFKLKYLESKKQKEISASLHISENTVKTQLSRAREKLRKLLTVLMISFALLG